MIKTLHLFLFKAKKKWYTVLYKVGYIENDLIHKEIDIIKFDVTGDHDLSSMNSYKGLILSYLNL